MEEIIFGAWEREGRIGIGHYKVLPDGKTELIEKIDSVPISDLKKPLLSGGRLNPQVKQFFDNLTDVDSANLSGIGDLFFNKLNGDELVALRNALKTNPEYGEIVESLGKATAPNISYIGTPPSGASLYIVNGKGDIQQSLSSINFRDIGNPTNAGRVRSFFNNIVENGLDTPGRVTDFVLDSKLTVSQISDIEKVLRDSGDPKFNNLLENLSSAKSLAPMRRADAVDLKEFPVAGAAGPKTILAAVAGHETSLDSLDRRPTTMPTLS